MLDTKKSNLLLSDERREKVKAKVQECLALAELHYGQSFEMPEIRYDVKNTDGGLAYHKQWLIRLNLILMVENEEHFLATTVPHEAAHLIARRVHHARLAAEGKRMRPHGVEWKEAMALLSIPPKVTHNYDVTSIEKPKRRPRGSKLAGAEADILLRRLTVAGRRLPPRYLDALIDSLEQFREDLA